MDDEDYERLMALGPWSLARRGSKLYAQRSYTLEYMHRIVTGAAKGCKVDHEDGDGLNNRRANLRAASTLQNNWNAVKKASNTSGFKGVYWDARRQKWICKVRYGEGKRWSSQQCDTPEQAAELGSAFRRAHHGEFARDA